MEYTVKNCAEIKTDVLVVGGGTAGCFAAISAAKGGAKVLLLEKNGVLGGTVTSCAVAYPGLFHAWGRQIIDGPCWQSVLRTQHRGGAQLPSVTFHPQYHWQEQVKVDPFVYACVLDEMCRESGVCVQLHTMLCTATEEENGVCALAAGKEGPTLIHAKVLIDATGDANAAGLLGFARERSAALQPATLINNIGGYDFSSLNKEPFLAFLAKKTAEGRLSPQDYQGDSLWSQLAAGRLSMHTPCSPEAGSSAGRGALEATARAGLARLVSVLREYPGLEGLKVTFCATECGVRETWRIVGEETMRCADYLAGRVYDDAVCYCFYPVDRHEPEGIFQIFLKENVVPTVPYGALIPKGARYVLAAGRCVASDTDTNSAVRVEAPCMAMGQAAGAAAALAAAEGCAVTKVPYAALCARLKDLGAIVPVEK